MLKTNKLWLVIFGLICICSVLRADLNSGEEDEDLESLDSIMPQIQEVKPRELAGKLQIEILKKADKCGREAKKGDILHMHYRGSLKNGEVEFDNSYKRGQPLTFKLGVGQVIKGWDQGLLGICASEKRKLVIPSHLAYGAMGSPPTIPPDSTLVFEVEAVKVEAGNRDDL